MKTFTVAFSDLTIFTSFSFMVKLCNNNKIVESMKVFSYNNYGIIRRKVAINIQLCTTCIVKMYSYACAV